MRDYKAEVYRIYELASDKVDPIIDEVIKESSIQTITTDWGMIYFVWSKSQIFVLDYISHEGYQSVRECYEASGGYFADFYSDIAEFKSIGEMFVKMKEMEF